MADPLDHLDAGSRKLLRRQKHPGFVKPMLATLTDDHFSSPDWIYERKLDGWRCIASVERGKVRLWTRNRNDITANYPEVADALSGQPQRNFIADGELVAYAGKTTSFSRLQQRLTPPVPGERPGIAIQLLLFDLPWFAGYDLASLPLIDRRAVLKRAFSYDRTVRFSQHRRTEGAKYFKQACRDGWEGLVAKRADSTYQNNRSRDWLKFKCATEQEFVIVGYTDPQGAREGFGALLIGYHENGDLLYAGKVGTGFDEAVLRRLHRKLAAIRRDKPTVADPPPEARGAHWVKPVLVGQIGFSEWTREGRLRHPRFLGLRTDKPARAIVRERPL